MYLLCTNTSFSFSPMLLGEIGIRKEVIPAHGRCCVMQFIVYANDDIPFSISIVYICFMTWMAFFSPRCSSLFVGSPSTLWTIIKKTVLYLIFLQVKTGMYITMWLSRSLAISRVCVCVCVCHRLSPNWILETCCCHSNESPFEGRILGRAVASPKVLGALVWKYLVSIST